jgi:nitroreductase
MGVERSDKMGRLMAMGRNFDFFGAPVGIIFTVHQDMEPPQWSDTGMFMQTLMLLAREYGLHTCAQEAWGQWPESCSEVCGIPKDEIVFAGMAIGKPDPGAEVNRLKTTRAPIGEVATFLGFGGQEGAGLRPKL